VVGKLSGVACASPKRSSEGQVLNTKDKARNGEGDEAEEDDPECMSREP
jgi:hypothetical protein